MGPFVRVFFLILSLTTHYWTPTLLPPGYLKKAQPFLPVLVCYLSPILAFFFENEKKTQYLHPPVVKNGLFHVFLATPGQVIHSTQPDRWSGPLPVNNGGNPTQMSGEVDLSKVNING